jgi:hypothetical protein
MLIELMFEVFELVESENAMAFLVVKEQKRPLGKEGFHG